MVSNGTISHGPIVSTGQIFIDEALEEKIMALEPYASHTQIERVPNDLDGIYTTESMSKSSVPLHMSVIKVHCFAVSMSFLYHWSVQN